MKISYIELASNSLLQIWKSVQIRKMYWLAMVLCSKLTHHHHRTQSRVYPQYPLKKPLHMLRPTLSCHRFLFELEVIKANNCLSIFEKKSQKEATKASSYKWIIHWDRIVTAWVNYFVPSNHPLSGLVVAAPDLFRTHRQCRASGSKLLQGQLGSNDFSWWTPLIHKWF